MMTSGAGADPTLSPSNAKAHGGSWSQRHFVPEPGSNNNKSMVRDFPNLVDAYYSSWYYINQGFGAELGLPGTRNIMEWKVNSVSSETCAGIRERKIALYSQIIDGVRQLTANIHECATPGKAKPNFGSGYIDFSTGTACNLRRVSPKPIPFQDWFQLEARLKATQSNGVLQIWQHSGGSTELIFDLQHPDFNMLSVQGTDGCYSTSPHVGPALGLYVLGIPSTPANAPQEIFLDDMYITDYRVGPGTATTPPPSATLTATPDTILSGQSSTLSWSSTNAASCTASGGWTGVKATSGTQSVSPTTTTQYTITCTGSGGSATANATVTVNVSRPSYIAYKISSPPAIDGNLQEFQNANTLTTTGQAGNNAGTYKLLWDATNLYIGGMVQDSDLGATRILRDDVIWNDDSVQVSLDTLKNRGTGMGTDDYRFFVSLLNTQRDVQGGAAGAGFNASGFASAVQLQGTNMNSADTDTGYAVEMKIPWADLGLSSPAANAVWGFDLDMNDNDPSTMDPAQAEYEQPPWANVDGGSINEPDGWGDLVFSGTTVPGGSTSGPVGHWTFDEGSGQTAADSAGSAPAVRGATTAAESTDPAWTSASRLGAGALSFDGLDDGVSVPLPSSLNTLTSFTYTGWLYPTGWGPEGYGRIFAHNEPKTSPTHFRFMMDSPGGNTLLSKIENTAGTEFVTRASLNAIALNGWSHVAFIYNDAGDRKLHMYVNGIETGYQRQDALSGTLATTNAALLIGNHGSRSSGFAGTIDDVRIYNRALSSSEIQTLANPATGPVPCHQYAPGVSVPYGYGVPWDVGTSELLIKATCDTASARSDLGKGDALQYIYKTGYLFKTGGSAWSPISYTSAETLMYNAWYPKTANATISLTSTELAQPSYVLGYLCTWMGTQWKCGCRDSSCTQSYWQIQSFKR